MNDARLWIALILMASGCSATITPPAAPRDPTVIYLADYGRHSSILLPNPSTAGFTEYNWGDWEWFAVGDTNWYVAIQAMLFSPQSTLGQRNVPAKRDLSALRKLLGADRVIPIDVSAQRAESLRAKLNERFSAASTTLMHSSYSQLEHVKDDERYCVLHNCNHVTARWLRQMGCEVDRDPILSNFKLKQH